MLGCCCFIFSIAPPTVPGFLKRERVCYVILHAAFGVKGDPVLFAQDSRKGHIAKGIGKIHL